MRNMIFCLARPLMRLWRLDERGGIGVMVAVLIAAGVLLGMGALVIDAGEIYQNRAELQNGADAGALAVAKSCATGGCNPTLAGHYAAANASTLTGKTDGVYSVCGSGIAGACPANPGGITNCPTPAVGTNWVDVNTYTQLPSGSHFLPPALARTLLGMSGYTGPTVYACAQATWGAPTVANAVGFTISACEWDTATSNGVTYAPAPPYPPYPFSSDQLIKLHDYTKNVTSAGCPANPADADAPGAFGWLQDKSTTCTVSINTNNQYFTGTGVNAGYCATVLQAAWQNQTVVYVPVFNAVASNGGNTYYTLKGLAAFVVTGYRLPGPGANGYSEPDYLNGNKVPCKAPTVCISGVFTQALCDPSACPALGGTNLGLSGIHLTG